MSNIGVHGVDDLLGLDQGLQRHGQLAAQAQAVFRQHGKDAVEHTRKRAGLVGIFEIAHHHQFDVLAELIHVHLFEGRAEAQQGFRQLVGVPSR